MYPLYITIMQDAINRPPDVKVFNGIVTIVRVRDNVVLVTIGPKTYRETIDDPAMPVDSFIEWSVQQAGLPLRGGRMIRHEETAVRGTVTRYVESRSYQQATLTNNAWIQTGSGAVHLKLKTLAPFAEGDTVEVEGLAKTTSGGTVLHVRRVLSVNGRVTYSPPAGPNVRLAVRPDHVLVTVAGRAFRYEPPGAPAGRPGALRRRPDDAARFGSLRVHPGLQGEGARRKTMLVNVAFSPHASVHRVAEQVDYSGAGARTTTCGQSLLGRDIELLATGAFPVTCKRCRKFLGNAPENR